MLASQGTKEGFCSHMWMIRLGSTYLFSPCISVGFLCILCTSAAPQWPAPSTVPSQVANHPLKDWQSCRVLRRRRFRTLDYWFVVRHFAIKSPILPKSPLLLTYGPLLHVWFGQLGGLCNIWIWNLFNTVGSQKGQKYGICIIDSNNFDLMAMSGGSGGCQPVRKPSSG